MEKADSVVLQEPKMKLFRSRVTPLENLTFLAMLVAFDAILSLVGALLPLASIFIMLLAPLTSASVSLFCKKRYIPLYLFAALGISVAVTAWDFMNTLFYLFPSLLTGSLYGLLWKAKAPSSINIFLTALLSFGLFYLSMYIIKLLLSGVDMADVLLSFIGKKDDPYARTVFPLFIFGYSLTQTALSHVFLLYQLRRLGKEESQEGAFIYWHPVIAVTFSAVAIIIGLFHAKIGYFMLGVAIYWAVFALINALLKPKPFVIAGLVISLFIGALVFAGAYRHMPDQSGLLLLGIPVALLSLTQFLSYIPNPSLRKD